MSSIATLSKPNHLDRPQGVKPGNGHQAGQRPPYVVWRMGVERYHQMIEAGILTNDDPVELLEGWLIQKIPKGPHHTSAIFSLRKTFEALFTEEWYIDSQDAITLIESEPEPDLYIARGNAKRYRNRHPYADDLVLIVEVAEATLSRDRNLKKRIYAQAGIPTYWIVNLVDKQIEVYSEPTTKTKNPTYSQRRDYGFTQKVPLLIAGEVIGEISVADVIVVE
ncbi:MAG: Uma2 family endonuclease [Caldilineaceae bacterium]